MPFGQRDHLVRGRAAEKVVRLQFAPWRRLNKVVSIPASGVTRAKGVHGP
jgi:hypothetical protein